MSRAALAVAALGLAAALAGCGVQPWVKPYERAALAEPIMSFDRDPVSAGYRRHVYEVREGAQGANGGGGGGCGCN